MMVIWSGPYDVEEAVRFQSNHDKSEAVPFEDGVSRTTILLKKAVDRRR
jgi:hypothetical protein